MRHGHVEEVCWSLTAGIQVPAHGSRCFLLPVEYWAFYQSLKHLLCVPHCGGSFCVAPWFSLSAVLACHCVRVVKGFPPKGRAFSFRPSCSVSPRIQMLARVPSVREADPGVPACSQVICVEIVHCKCKSLGSRRGKLALCPLACCRGGSLVGCCGFFLFL